MGDLPVLIDLVGYRHMVLLEKFAALIATDFGGVQKEAFFYQVPCVTLRDETEWAELVDTGSNQLASPFGASQLAATMKAAIGRKGTPVQPYGDGNAAHKIVDSLAMGFSA